jgi:glutathione peroxidase
MQDWKNMMTDKIDDISLKTIEGKATSLGKWQGKVRLVVNVASACGLTPQYAGLQQLQEKYGARGFTVLGFPANDFGAQEPGSNDEIAEFCSTKYKVTFPMFEKISVLGEALHPLYGALIAAAPKATAKSGDFRARLAGYGIKPKAESDILWNFEKFLITRNGKVTARFAPDIEPGDELITKAIEAELAK